MNPPAPRPPKGRVGLPPPSASETAAAKAASERERGLSGSIRVSNPSPTPPFLQEFINLCRSSKVLKDGDLSEVVEWLKTGIGHFSPVRVHSLLSPLFVS